MTPNVVAPHRPHESLVLSAGLVGEWRYSARGEVIAETWWCIGCGFTWVAGTVDRVGDAYLVPADLDAEVWARLYLRNRPPRSDRKCQ